jgi:hypothetical protein
MLAEVRKYRQGVLLLDQRPGSLVGGCIDNAYLVAMHRLNEKKSFDQFCDMLNLGPDQRRFARVGLRPGEAVLLDREAGMPFLLQPPVQPKETLKEGKTDEQLDQQLAQEMKERVARLHYPDVTPELLGVIQEVGARRARELVQEVERVRAAAPGKRLSGDATAELRKRILVCARDVGQANERVINALKLYIVKKVGLSRQELLELFKVG